MQLHPDFSCRVDHVGNEKQPVLVVDNFLSDPLSLKEFCVNNLQLNKVDGLYPGLRASAPEGYLQLIHYYLRDIIHSTFSIDDSMVKHVKADYSMVLTPVNQLTLAQCVPHYDSLIPSELAAVHYLCGSDKGGTSLYRHRDTGFEFVDSSRAAVYTERLKRGISGTAYPQRYMNGSNHLFEQIVSYEAIFNRIIIYRCTSLHSGNIAPDFLFDPNPHTGRLTINTFIGQ